MSKVALNEKPKKKKKTPFKDAGSILGRSVGNWLGHGEIGSHLGASAGSFLGRILGSGAYALKKNSLFGPQVPAMHSSSETVVFRHREYLGDVYGTSAFTNARFSINPGLATSFPYLSSIARNFQQYRFKGLVYQFKSTSATALVSGTNTAMGTVMMAVQYEPNAADFINKEQMLNEMWASDARCSEHVLMPVECAPGKTGQDLYYVRSGSTTEDLKDIDMGILNIATYGSQATNNIGELWVTYEIELCKPIAASIGGSLNPYAWYKRTAVTNGAAPLGGSYSSSFDNIGCGVGSNLIAFPSGLSGKYMIVVNWYSDGADVAWAPPALTYTNCSNTGLQGGNYYAPANTANTKAAIWQFGVLISDPNLKASITVGLAGTLPTNGNTVCIVNIVPVAYATT